MGAIPFDDLHRVSGELRQLFVHAEVGDHQVHELQAGGRIDVGAELGAVAMVAVELSEVERALGAERALIELILGRQLVRRREQQITAAEDEPENRAGIVGCLDARPEAERSER